MQQQGARETPVHLVEQHVIKWGDPRFALIDRTAFASKNLYTAASYEFRPACIVQGVSLGYPEMHQRMKDHEDYKAYKALPAKVAQQVLRTLEKNRQNFVAARTSWEDDPSTFLGRSRLPRYKDKREGRNLLAYTIQAFSLPTLRRGLICPSMLGITVQTKQRHQYIQQVRIIPRKGFYVVEVVYE
ncbi:MAG TPA: hypothetical protein VGP82_04040 [Ktedonobacterales bacterium]|nr:hypothetical protein [Ktedonobacterales bacterium]